MSPGLLRRVFGSREEPEKARSGPFAPRPYAHPHQRLPHTKPPRDKRRSERPRLTGAVRSRRPSPSPRCGSNG